MSMMIKFMGGRVRSREECGGRERESLCVWIWRLRRKYIGGSFDRGIKIILLSSFYSPP